jgi:hypothetical protein
MAFAQEDTTITITGDQWMDYTFDQKVGIIAGWLMAVYATYYFAAKLEPDTLYIWHRHFPVAADVTMAEIVNRIDHYYIRNGYHTELFVIIGKIMEQEQKNGL